MPNATSSLAAALLLAVAPGAASAPERPGVGVAQLVLQQRIVVRLHREAAPAPVQWREKKGPKCVATDRLAGVVVVRADAVDLVEDGGERFRARLDDDCAAVDFYGGFYLKPHRDGKLCAGRDAIRARSGQVCGIEKFRRLVPKK